MSTRTALDLIIRGGRVYDPSLGIDRIADVGIRAGRIVEISDNVDGPGVERAQVPLHLTNEIDASGLYVTSGFIDLHAHVFTGICPLTVPADETSSRSGVTTVVSAGDAGAHTIEGFRRLIVDRSRTRVLAFLHISSIGLASWPVGESILLDMLDPVSAIRAIENHRDLVVGIKVRETAPDVVGSNGLEPLRRALVVGEAVDLPVMCHIGNTPTVLTNVLDMLRPGDIVTHCFTGSANSLVVDGGLVDGAWEARERGVLFDIGHGFGSFDFAVAELAAGQGMWPTTISTDIHSLSATSAMRDLPTTMSKLLSLGMPFDRVISAVTSEPAKAIGRDAEMGHLRVGDVADLTLLRVEDTDWKAQDAFGNTRVLGQRIVVEHTVRAGVPWGGPYPHPSSAF